MTTQDQPDLTAAICLHCKRPITRDQDTVVTVSQQRYHFVCYEGLKRHEDCGPLCPQHGDVRDTSYVKTGPLPQRRCYFCAQNPATTTRTRPDGAMLYCPACKDCADLIDEQNYNDARAEESYARMITEQSRG